MRFIAILHLPNAAAYGAKLPACPGEYFQSKHPSINISCKSYFACLEKAGLRGKSLSTNVFIYNTDFYLFIFDLFYKYLGLEICILSFHFEF